MNFFRNKLGIDEIIERVNYIGEYLKRDNDKVLVNSKNDTLKFIDPLENKPFLTIESIKEYNKDEYKTSKPIGNVGRFNMFLQACPIAQVLAQDNQLKGAYKVVFPEGSIGKLMQYKNGLLGTPLVDCSNKVKGHAGILSIDRLPIGPTMVFSMMSMVTGQYFLSQINKSLKNISTDIKDIIEMMLDDKEARTESIYFFYLEIKENLNLIIDNDDMRITYLTNVKSTLIDLRQNVKFYEKTINRKQENICLNYNKDHIQAKKQVENVEEVLEDVKDLLMQRYVCLELYTYGKILDVQLSQSYDKHYCTKIIKELNDILLQSSNYSYQIKKQYNEILSKIGNKSLIYSDKKINSKKLEIDRSLETYNNCFRNNINNIIDTLNDMIIFNSRENIFIVEDEELYLI